jgi:hypothetical protein
MVVAAVISLLCAAGAVGSFLRASALRSDAAFLMLRGNKQAAEYASSFDGTVAEQQLATFEQRRAVLELARPWQVLQLLMVMATVVTAFASYVFFLFRRLREQLVDALPEDDGLPHPALARSGRLD